MGDTVAWNPSADADAGVSPMLPAETPATPKLRVLGYSFARESFRFHGLAATAVHTLVGWLGSGGRC